MFSKAGVAEELGMSYDEIISQYADSMDSQCFQLIKDKNEISMLGILVRSK